MLIERNTDDVQAVFIRITLCIEATWIAHWVQTDKVVVTLAKCKYRFHTFAISR